MRKESTIKEDLKKKLEIYLKKINVPIIERTERDKLPK